jgi:hypothetical protein
MQFSKVFYRYVTSAAGPATIAIGADQDPTTVYGTEGTPPQNQSNPKLVSAANVDNGIGCRVNGQSAPVAVHRIAVAMCGPTGAASCTVNLYVWDALTMHWYLVNSSPVTLAQNTLTFIDAVSPCEPVPAGNSSGTSGSQGGVDYQLVVIPAGSPTAGVYSFAMAAILNDT